MNSFLFSGYATGSHTPITMRLLFILRHRYPLRRRIQSTAAKETKQFLCQSHFSYFFVKWFYYLTSHVHASNVSALSFQEDDCTYVLVGGVKLTEVYKKWLQWRNIYAVIVTVGFMFLLKFFFFQFLVKSPANGVEDCSDRCEANKDCVASECGLFSTALYPALRKLAQNIVTLT